MDRSIVELVKAADVIGVSVRSDSEQISLEEVCGRLAQACDAEAGIDEQIMRTSTYMPDVAAQEWVNEGFGQERDRIVDTPAMEPVVGHWQPGTRHPADRNAWFAGLYEWSNLPLDINGHYEPVVGSFADDATDDVLWYGPGSAADYLWDFAATPPGTVELSSRSMPVNGFYFPVSLDEWNDGAGGDDIVWVGPGDDHVWDFRGGVLRRWVDGNDVDLETWPHAGDFLGDGHEDILWTSSSDVVLWDHAPIPGSPASLVRWTYDDLAE